MDLKLDRSLGNGIAALDEDEFAAQRRIKGAADSEKRSMKSTIPPWIRLGLLEVDPLLMENRAEA